MYIIKHIAKTANAYIAHRRVVAQAESLPFNLCSNAANINVKHATSDISPIVNIAVIFIV